MFSPGVFKLAETLLIRPPGWHSCCRGVAEQVATANISAPTLRSCTAVLRSSGLSETRQEVTLAALDIFLLLLCWVSQQQLLLLLLTGFC
jgi:hypothetical protein